MTTPNNSELEKEIKEILHDFAVGYQVESRGGRREDLNKAVNKLLPLIHTENQRAVEEYKLKLEIRILKDDWFADNDRDRVYLHMREATINHKEKKS